MYVIARALSNNPKLLLMDEPLGAVDPINIDMIKKIIIDLQKKGGVSVLITDHSCTECFKYCGSLFNLIVDGEIICKRKTK